MIDFFDVDGPDINATVDATSFTTASWTPPTSGLILVFIFSNNAAGGETHRVDSITGNGITWVEVDSQPYFTDDRRISLFAANAAGSSAGTVLIDFGADIQGSCQALFFYATGVDLSGGVLAAFVQTPSNTATTGTEGTITLVAAGHADNRAIACFSHAANEASTPRTNWTTLDDSASASPNKGTISEYRSDAFETTASATWTTSSQWGGQAAELKADLGDQPPISIPPIPQVVGRGRW